MKEVSELLTALGTLFFCSQSNRNGYCVLAEVINIANNFIRIEKG